ncbi:MAG: hypothetical protein KIS78_16700 [Labilithrix sp.]|nr:hypothetical protein [Labilithrix sp.]MCW5834041.1 hypothetical protein [Labilithrix sp.]
MHRSRRRPRRLVLALLVACAPALATFALAQTKPRAPAKPKPAPAAKVDAQAPPPAEEPNGANGDAAKATAPTASDAPPPPPSEVTDGGRLSPLNPQPQELPSNAVDAGVPVDYDRLLADIAALRARVAAVADNLYQSRISVALQTDGDRAKISRLTVSLDDGVVFTAPQSFAASDMTAVYDHAVAPGRHAVTVDVERKDTRDEAFRTSQRSRFTVDVPRDHKVDVQVKILDDSSMGGDFPSDRSGKYDLRLRVKAAAKPVGK